MKTKRFYQHLYFQVLTAISIGVASGISTLKPVPP